MRAPGFSYESCVALSERVAWSIGDVIPPGASLDFTKKFLPDSMIGASDIGFLSAGEKLTLNQIRGNSYAYVFQFIEEFIIAMTVTRAGAEALDDSSARRALARFSEEEVKHQKLFRLFNTLFETGFKAAPGVIQEPVAVAEAILQKSPMAVLLISLHLELMTQRHWVELVSKERPDELDPLFKSLLKHHWLEEAQHAKIDILELHRLSENATPAVLERAFDDYFEILRALDELLVEQAGHDVETLARAAGRSFTEAERAKLRASQVASYRDVFLRQGITAPGFMDVVGDLSSAGQERVASYLALLS